LGRLFFYGSLEPGTATLLVGEMLLLGFQRARNRKV
jgi:hypothetical protein